MKIHSTPSTELPRDFCAGIGRLQLGAVLVFRFCLGADVLKTVFLHATFVYNIVNSLY